MINFDSVTEQTKKLFLLIADANQNHLLNEMLLIGGTALSMRIGHRLSEDIDFATGALKLPVQNIAALMTLFESKGHEVIDIVDDSTRHDFINDGLDVENYHQDWLVDGVKLTFFTYGQNDYERNTINNAGFDSFEGIKIADLDAIAKTKCHVVTRRTKSRDFFDIDCLINSGILTIENVITEMQKSNPHMTYETAVFRLIEKPIQVNDEGLVSVGVEISIEQIRESLAARISAMESDIAKEYQIQKIQAQEASLEEAEKIAVQKDAFALADVKAKKAYSGKILGVTDFHVVQNLGMTAVIHRKVDLERIPSKDEMVNISYVDGRGKVEPPKSLDICD